jgi:hypothetical protein
MIVKDFIIGILECPVDAEVCYWCLTKPEGVEPWEKVDDLRYESANNTARIE